MPVAQSIYLKLIFNKTICMRIFKKLKIWQKGFQIAVNCFKVTATFPKDEKFGIISQINRSGVSIASNIAEGSSRSSEKDYYRFIEIALGSAFELETQMLIAGAANFGDQVLCKQLLQQLDEEQKMIMAFMNTLNK
jgi:four helix bundle protein